jgi:hypothetical protein
VIIASARASAIVGLAIVGGCTRSADPRATIPTASSAALAVDVPVEARRPLAESDACPLGWTPRAVGSVLRIPAEVMARPMSSVVAAACRCVRPGEDARVVAQIDVTAGQVVADAPDAPDVARCLEQITLPAFEPWSAGGASDCIDCGPRRYGVFRGSPRVDAPVEEARLRVTYPLRVDRSGETREADAR